MEVANPHGILLALLNVSCELLEAEFKTGVLGRHVELLLLPSLVLLVHQLELKLDGFLPSYTFLQVSAYCVFVLVKLQSVLKDLSTDVNCE